jgi:hypothetical protein
MSLALLVLLPRLSSGAEGGSQATIVFEEDRIEGKIRRPQLVLIKAEQRPEFEPMVIQSIGKEMNIVEFVSESVIEASPYRGPFEFNGTAITGYTP